MQDKSFIAYLRRAPAVSQTLDWFSVRTWSPSKIPERNYSRQINRIKDLVSEFEAPAHFITVLNRVTKILLLKVAQNAQNFAQIAQFLPPQVQEDKKLCSIFIKAPILIPAIWNRF